MRKYIIASIIVLIIIAGAVFYYWPKNKAVSNPAFNPDHIMPIAEIERYQDGDLVRVEGFVYGKQAVAGSNYVLILDPDKKDFAIVNFGSKTTDTFANSDRIAVTGKYVKSASQVCNKEWAANAANPGSLCSVPGVKEGIPFISIL